MSNSFYHHRLVKIRKRIKFAKRDFQRRTRYKRKNKNVRQKQICTAYRIIPLMLRRKSFIYRSMNDINVKIIILEKYNH